MSKRGHRSGHSHSQHEKSRPQKHQSGWSSPLLPAESFDELVNRLRGAVLAAKTPTEFNDARAEIRRSLSMWQVEQTDLPETCGAKARELGLEAP